MHGETMLILLLRQPVLKRLSPHMNRHRLYFMMRMFQIVIFRLLFALTLGLLPLDVFAHTGIGQTTGFLAGFCHPIGGADHLLTMFAVGLWAAQTGGRAVWAIPAVFVGLMVCGGILGVSGVFLPFVELSILTSVLILGLMIAAEFCVNSGELI